MLNNLITTFIDKKDFFNMLLIEHIKISFTSTLIAIIIGGLIGVLISEFKPSAKPTLGFISFIYTIPSISMLGFLIPFSGVGNTTAIIVLIIYALLPMVRNTYTGISNIDSNILEASKGMGSTRSQTLFRVKLPLALPVIMSGIRNMVTMTIALTGIASFIGAGGLGVAIYRGITTNNIEMTMVGSLLIALLALFTDFILGFLEKRLTKRNVKARRTNRIILAALAIMAMVAVGVGLISNVSRETINIGTKPMTEQYILGEILKTAIEEETDLNVNLILGVGGGTSHLHPGIEKGEFDIYPEYTGTGWNAVLKNDGLYSEEMFEDLQKQYADSYNLRWLGMYGFNNTYTLAVRKETADQYNLKSYSDLQGVSDQMTFGAEYDFFEREDGYNALCETYGLSFDKNLDMDLGLKFKALNQGKIDVAVVYTTDGQLDSPNIVVLEDDRQFFPSYQCGNIIREDVLEEHPELEDVFNRLTDSISEKDMAKMNNAVESDGREPAEVAREFLKSKRIIEND